MKQLLRTLQPAGPLPVVKPVEDIVAFLYVLYVPIVLLFQTTGLLMGFSVLLSRMTFYGKIVVEILELLYPMVCRLQVPNEWLLNCP